MEPSPDDNSEPAAPEKSFGIFGVVEDLRGTPCRWWVVPIFLRRFDGPGRPTTQVVCVWRR